jgi:hypothetical protein
MNREEFEGKRLEALLEVVGKKLGIPPEQLERELKQGKYDRALAGMDAAAAEKFRQAVQNPQLVDKLMSTPQAKALYAKLTGGK